MLVERVLSPGILRSLPEVESIDMIGGFEARPKAGLAGTFAIYSSSLSLQSRLDNPPTDLQYTETIERIVLYMAETSRILSSRAPPTVGGCPS